MVHYFESVCFFACTCKMQMKRIISKMKHLIFALF